MSAEHQGPCISYQWERGGVPSCMSCDLIKRSKQLATTAEAVLIQDAEIQRLKAELRAIQPVLSLLAQWKAAHEEVPFSTLIRILQERDEALAALRRREVKP